MKSPKLVLLGGVAFLTATVVVAQLTPEQRKAAEEALQKKMQELDARDGAKSAPRPQIVIKDSKPAPTASKSLTPEQEAKARAALNQAYAGNALSPEREAKARAALNQAYAKADKTLSPEQEAKARAALNQAYAKADKVLTPEQEAMAREALVAKNAELNKRDQQLASKAPAAPAAPAKTPTRLAKAPTGSAKAPAGLALAAAGSTIPATGKYQKPEDIGISQEQWNQLVDLTDAYRTDKIGAAEYHARRSEVIGGGAQ